MKKITSLLLTAVLLATMLTVFAVPASALGFKNKYCDGDIIDEPVIMRNLMVEEGATVRLDSFFGLGPRITLGKDSTFIIGSNGALTNISGESELLGDKDYASMIIAGDNPPKIIIENGGELDLTFKTEEDAKTFASIVQPFCDGNHVKWGTITEEEAQNIFTSVSQGGSTISNGDIWIIAGVACSVVFLAVGFFIGRKKKKPATAGGENKDEE